MAEQKSALDLLGHLSEDELLTELFRRRYDYHNLKVLLKAKHLRQEMGQAILDLGIVPVEILSEAVMAEEGRNLPESLARAMAAAEAAYAESQLPADLDVAVEREGYAFMARGILATGNSFLTAWLAREVDFLNIKTFLRLHWLGENLKSIDRVLMPGGHLGAGVFRDIREAPLDTLGQVFAKTPYGKAVAEGIGQLKDHNSFAALERNFDDLMIQLLKRSRQASFGAEPLVAYLLLKDFEIRAVRAVLVGKLNQLPKEKIKERLPSEYV
jgi:V/A-type H+-transporting ATPase subunit C